jgi:hypothetical protein
MAGSGLALVQALVARKQSVGARHAVPGERTWRDWAIRRTRGLCTVGLWPALLVKGSSRPEFVVASEVLIHGSAIKNPHKPSKISKLKISNRR